MQIKKYSVCDYILPGGNLNMAVSKPVMSDSFKAAMCDIIELGDRIKNGYHPKDHAEGKTNLPMICPAQYPDTRCKKAPGMEWAFGAVDWDGPGTPETLPEAKEKLRGIRSLIHTTTHHTRATPSYRVFVDTTRYLHEIEIPGFLKFMDGILGGGVNQNAKDVSRRFFVPHDGYEVAMHDEDTDVPIDPKQFRGLVQLPVKVKPAPIIVSPVPEDGFARIRKAKYLKGVIDGVCEDIILAPEGSQNNQIFKSACRLGGLIRVGALEEVGEIDGVELCQEYLVSRLVEAAHRGNHPDGRAASAITSGMVKGMNDETAISLDEQMARSSRVGQPRTMNDRVFRHIARMKRF